MAMLSLEHVCSYYGDAQALTDIDLEVGDDEIVAVIGPNGAGKTTMLRTISGLIRPRGGSIRFQGQAIDRQPAHELIGLGIAHVPEGRRLFPQMTVRENLLMGAFGAASWKQRSSLIDEVCAWFPRPQERISQLAGTLSGGERQILATARALMARPRLLMLDEPSLGLAAPRIVETVLSIIRDINRRGVAILLVEQNARMALQAAGRAYLLSGGAVVKSGETATFVADESVRRSYLGI